jgi:hypothetical protein
MNVRMLALLIAICGLAGGSNKGLARALPNQDQNQGQQPTVEPMDKTPVLCLVPPGPLIAGTVGFYQVRFWGRSYVAQRRETRRNRVRPFGM